MASVMIAARLRLLLAYGRERPQPECRAAPKVCPLLSCAGGRGRRRRQPPELKWSALLVNSKHWQALIHYRVYQLDTAGHILAGHSIVCRSDAEAMGAARRFAEQAAAVEVWESARRVGRLRQRQ